MKPGPLLALLALGACRGGAPAGVPADAAGDLPGPPGPAADAGRPGPAVFAPSDGKRLKARWMEGPQGTRTLWGWYDTQLAVPCRFARAIDGRLRCLPAGPGIDGVEFSDSSCTRPAITRPFRSCEAPEKHAVRFEDDLCGGRQRIYPVEQRIADNQLWERLDGICQPVKHPETSASFMVGEELPPGTFVEATPVVEPGATGSLRLVVLEAEDGARQDWGWRTEGGADCAPIRLSDGRLHCVPLAAVPGGAYADEMCRERAATFDPTCGAREVLLESTADRCSGARQVRALGPRLDSPFSVFGCMRFTPPDYREYHAVGAQLPDDQFPAFEVITEPGARLRRQLLVAGRRAVTWSWVDDDRSLTCFPLLYQGKRRCVPSGYASSTEHYADPACTRPLWRTRRDACPVQFVDGVDNRSCPRPRILFSVGPVHTGPVYRLTLTPAIGTAVHQCLTAPAGPDEVTYALTPLADEQLLEVKLVEPL